MGPRAINGDGNCHLLRLSYSYQIYYYITLLILIQVVEFIKKKKFNKRTMKKKSLKIPEVHHQLKFSTFIEAIFYLKKKIKI